MKWILLVCVFLVGCGNDGGFVSTKTDKTPPVLRMPGGSFHYDCWAELKQLNGKDFEGVIDESFDLAPEMPGIQIEVGVLLYGNVSPNEEPWVVVNEDVYATYRTDFLYVANVSLDRPAKQVMFRSMTTQKLCDTDSLIVSLK